MNGGSSALVPRLYPLRSLVCTLFNKGGSRGAFRLPGASGDHVHCTVDPSSGHIRCRRFAANRLILANRFSVSESEPFFSANHAAGGSLSCESQV